MKNKLKELMDIIERLYDEGLMDYNAYNELFDYIDYIFESE